MDANTNEKKIEKGTVYFRSEFIGNMKKIEARDISVKIRPYAQYRYAIEVTFTRKGCRKAHSFVQSYSPSLVVLAGWGHVDPDSPWTKGEKRGGVEVSQSLYSSCDERWGTDFDAKLRAYLEGSPSVKVAADFRKHNPN